MPLPVSFRDMASFLLKNAQFSCPTPFNPNLNMFPLDWMTEILHARVSYTWLITRATSFPLRPKVLPQ